MYIYIYIYTGDEYDLYHRPVMGRVYRLGIFTHIRARARTHTHACTQLCTSLKCWKTQMRSEYMEHAEKL